MEVIGIFIGVFSLIIFAVALIIILLDSAVKHTDEKDEPSKFRKWRDDNKAELEAEEAKEKAKQAQKVQAKAANSEPAWRNWLNEVKAELNKEDVDTASMETYTPSKKSAAKRSNRRNQGKTNRKQKVVSAVQQAEPSSESASLKTNELKAAPLAADTRGTTRQYDMNDLANQLDHLARQYDEEKTYAPKVKANQMKVKKLRQAIIYKEILDKPKSLQH